VRPFALVQVASLLAALALPVGAQQSTSGATPRATAALPVVPGARVKVSASTLVTPLLANYLEMRGDTAVFIEASAGRGIWTFTMDQITRIEQSQGEKRYNKRPMLIGAAVGAPVGVLLFWGTTGIIKPGDSGKRYNRSATAGAGLVVGAAIGALVGTRFTEEHWMPLPLPKRLSIMPTRRNGVDVGFGFSF
jgi:hypothetical protein